MCCREISEIARQLQSRRKMVDTLRDNKSAEAAFQIFTELIKSGRYSDPDLSIEEILKEPAKIKKTYEELWMRDSE